MACGALSSNMLSPQFQRVKLQTASLPARVATLSQHLFYEPPQPTRFGAGQRAFTNGFREIAKVVAGILIPKRRQLEARSTSTGSLLPANSGRSGRPGERPSRPKVVVCSTANFGRLLTGRFPDNRSRSCRQGSRPNPQRSSDRQFSIAG
jgi:hypothetical protein